MFESLRTAAGTAAAAVFVCLSVCMWGGAAHAAQPLPDRLELYGGEVSVFSVNRPLARVAVGNGDLLEVMTVERQQIVIIAEAGQQGFTAMHLWFEDGSHRTVDVNIRPANTSGFAGAIREMLGSSTGIQVTEVGGHLVVSGELSADDQKRLGALKEVYPNIVDLSSVDEVSMQPMVLMDVRIMEFRTDALRDLGIRWDSTIDGPSGGTIGDFRRSFFRILPEGSPFLDLDQLPARISPMQTYFGLATTISSRINLLTTSGKAWELANPQLSARSGGEANFLVGGRIPIPITTGFGATSVQYETYGIKLDIAPFVNSNNQISANISTEISNIDPTVTVLGIPGFTSREARTEINVSNGETIVISGLVDVSAVDSMEGIPGLSRIPILGRLFRSDNFRSGRTDLVIFVTPRVVLPDSPHNLELLDKAGSMQSGLEERLGSQIFD